MFEFAPKRDLAFSAREIVISKSRELIVNDNQFSQIAHSSGHWATRAR